MSNTTKEQRDAAIEKAVHQVENGNGFMRPAAQAKEASPIANGITLGVSHDTLLEYTIKQYEFEDKHREGVLSDVRGERMRQDELCSDYFNRQNGWRKFSESDSKLEYKLAVLGEEVGEVSTAVLRSSDVDTDVQLYDELVQVAAVAVAWAEAISQKREKLNDNSGTGL